MVTVGARRVCGRDGILRGAGRVDRGEEVHRPALLNLGGLSIAGIAEDDVEGRVGGAAVSPFRSPAPSAAALKPENVTWSGRSTSMAAPLGATLVNRWTFCSPGAEARISAR